MHWLQSLALEIGGADRLRDMLGGKGVSLILGEISLKFHRPVVYPDTVSSVLFPLYIDCLIECCNMLRSFSSHIGHTLPQLRTSSVQRRSGRMPNVL